MNILESEEPKRNDFGAICEKLKSLEKSLSDPNLSSIARKVMITRIRSLLRSDEYVEWVVERLSEPSLNPKERSKLIREIASNKQLSVSRREQILNQIVLKTGGRPDLHERSNRSRLLATIQRRTTSTTTQESSPPRKMTDDETEDTTPDPDSIATAKRLVKGLCRAFEAQTSFDLVTDFTPASLAKLDEYMSNLNLEPPKNDYEEFLLQLFLLGAGSYFGEVVVRNLGGEWQYPSWFRRFWGRKTGLFGYTYSALSIKANNRKVPVLDLARCVLERREHASFFKAYQYLAFGRN